jgi:hypothetical protein
MIEAAERSLSNQAYVQASSAFRQTVGPQQSAQNFSAGPGGPSVLSSIPGFTQPQQ